MREIHTLDLFLNLRRKHRINTFQTQGIFTPDCYSQWCEKTHIRIQHTWTKEGDTVCTKSTGTIEIHTRGGKKEKNKPQSKTINTSTE